MSCLSSAWRWRLRHFGLLLVVFCAWQKVGLFSYHTVHFFPRIHFSNNLVSDFSPPSDRSPEPVYFTLKDGSLTATEGSCAEIKCLARHVDVDRNSKWFWMKDAKWDEENKNFTASIIYSSHNSLYTVSGDYATRVKYIGSPFTTWNNPQLTQKCSILICNLKKGDSGSYKFRFEGKIKWATAEIKLSVTGQWNIRI